MADTDLKPISELPLYNNLMDYNSLVPFVVSPSGSSVTRKVFFPALKTLFCGYEIAGVLTAGSTSITLSSVGNTYNDQNSYSVGDKVIYTGDDEVARNYICIHGCSPSNWETNGRYFVEYTPLNNDSNIRIFVKKYGVAPTDVSISNNAITLTFAEQSEDIGVKVRIY